MCSNERANSTTSDLIVVYLRTYMPNFSLQHLLVLVLHTEIRAFLYLSPLILELPSLPGQLLIPSPVCSHCVSARAPPKRLYDRISSRPRSPYHRRLSCPCILSSLVAPAARISSCCIFFSNPSLFAIKAPLCSSSTAILSAGVASRCFLTFCLIVSFYSEIKL